MSHLNRSCRYGRFCKNELCSYNHDVSQQGIDRSFYMLLCRIASDLKESTSELSYWIRQFSINRFYSAVDVALKSNAKLFEKWNIPMRVYHECNKFHQNSLGRAAIFNPKPNFRNNSSTDAEFVRHWSAWKGLGDIFMDFALNSMKRSLLSCHSSLCLDRNWITTGWLVLQTPVMLLQFPLILVEWIPTT